MVGIGVRGRRAAAGLEERRGAVGIHGGPGGRASGKKKGWEGREAGLDPPDLGANLRARLGALLEFIFSLNS